MYIDIVQQIRAMANGKYAHASLPPINFPGQVPDTVCRSGNLISRLSEFCQSVEETRIVIQDKPLRNDNSMRESLDGLLQQTHSLLDEIETWHSTSPKHWSSQYPAQTAENVVWSNVETERDPWTMCFLSAVQAAQTAFYSSLLELCNDLRASDTEARASSFLEHFKNASLKDYIRYLVDVLCSTIRYALGEVDTYGEFKVLQNAKQLHVSTLRWPVLIVLNCSFLTEEQLYFLRKALAYMESRST